MGESKNGQAYIYDSIIKKMEIRPSDDCVYATVS